MCCRQLSYTCVEDTCCVCVLLTCVVAMHCGHVLCISRVDMCCIHVSILTELYELISTMLREIDDILVLFAYLLEVLRNSPIHLNSHPCFIVADPRTVFANLSQN